MGNALRHDAFEKVSMSGSGKEKGRNGEYRCKKRCSAHHRMPLPRSMVDNAPTMKLTLSHPTDTEISGAYYARVQHRQKRPFRLPVTASP
jgi:hypothetical protein